ncbi:MAG TPA: 3-phosphoshikimate 1-carboxyvinyltransferase [Candidatus Polarisedimenticolia bacterium]|nr:3-phosphoshikimate 1-carboxyvinyltransferase [Candidatus Polarisedimenticolia bacterium]
MFNEARAIQAGGAVDADLVAPPSKSVTQRLLILGALASGVSRIVQPLDADDTRVMAEALRAVGIGIGQGARAWEIRGGGGRLPSPGASVDAGSAGTAARFLTALLCLGRGRYLLDGSPRMRERPIQPLVDALRELGARIRYLGTRGSPPLEILAEGLRGGRVSIRAGMSSQYLSALLLVAPRAAGALRIAPEGEIASAPYLRLTAQVMVRFGIELQEPAPLSFSVEPQDFAGRELRVEGDYSSAGYFFAAAAITGGQVRVSNLQPDSAQADRGILEVLEKMGCKVIAQGEGVALSGGELEAADCNLSGMPDAAPTLAVTALFARGRSRFTGLSTLRVKETDRVAALARELARLGAEIREGPDFLEIQPRPLQGASIETYEDHRMAMSFALAGLRIPGVIIRDPGCVSKSFPEFWEAFAKLESA